MICDHPKRQTLQNRQKISRQGQGQYDVSMYTRQFQPNVSIMGIKYMENTTKISRKHFSTTNLAISKYLELNF